MGVILTSDDFIIDQVLDIIIIFVMGTILLFFVYTMLHHPKLFLVCFSLYITLLLVLMLTYINSYCGDNNGTQKNKLSFINFMCIYTICLNIFMASVVSSNVI